MLRFQGVTKSFAGLTALSNVGFELREGMIKGLIGPNGAGKTTLFNLVTGVFPPSMGSISFQGGEITRRKAEDIARLGISRTFQQPHLFRTLTACENVMLGRHHRTRAEFLATGFRLPWARREEQQIRERSMAYLEMVGLADRKDQIASSLPLGEQRMLEAARALAMEPKLLLLDEPTAGLNDRETAAFRDTLFKIREMGVTMLVIEHHMKFIMDISDEIMVLNFGSKIAEGPPSQVQQSPQVIEAYLGSEQEID